MTNEEFQILVIEKLGNLETSVQGLEEGQKEIIKSIQNRDEQTADLTKFIEEVEDQLHTLIEENLTIKQILGEHEVAIRTIRRRVV